MSKWEPREGNFGGDSTHVEEGDQRLGRRPLEGETMGWKQDSAWQLQSSGDEMQ